MLFLNRSTHGGSAQRTPPQPIHHASGHMASTPRKRGRSNPHPYTHSHQFQLLRRRPKRGFMSPSMFGGAEVGCSPGGTRCHPQHPPGPEAAPKSAAKQPSARARRATAGGTATASLSSSPTRSNSSWSCCFGKSVSFSSNQRYQPRFLSAHGYAIASRFYS